MLQVLGLARVGFCMASLDGVIQSADSTFTEMLRYESISRGDLTITDVTLPEDVGPLTDVMAKVAAAGGALVYRKRTIRQDGSTIWWKIAFPYSTAPTRRPS
ncbi:MAG: PAS domain-containing protein [Caulobacteraceae bacterium]